jgi:hypothetical protein
MDIYPNKHRVEPSKAAPARFERYHLAIISAEEFTFGGGVSSVNERSARSIEHFDYCATIYDCQAEEYLVHMFLSQCCVEDIFSNPWD